MNYIRRIINQITALYRWYALYRHIESDEFHNFWEQNHLKALLPFYDVDCVFDVGANRGQYALKLREEIKFKGLIISFEPIPETAAYLRKISADDPDWIIEECALSDVGGRQSFNIMADSQFSSLSEPKHDEFDLFLQKNTLSKKIMVKTETLDQAFQRFYEQYHFKHPFLKMDTQGFDVKIIESGKKTIKKFIGLQSELSIKKIYRDSVDFREAITLYQQQGFSLSALVPNNEGHFPRLVEIDCIMIRNDLL